MDNLHEFSPVESTVEPIKDEAPSASLETVPSGIEWGAMALGFVVGFVWEIAERIALAMLNGVIYQYKPALLGPWFMLFFNVASSLAQFTVLGLVVGWRARHHPYRFTAIVYFALFLVVFSFNQWIQRQVPNAPPPNLFRVAAFQTFYLVVALNGVYLAQSFKRNRGVRTQ